MVAVDGPRVILVEPGIPGNLGFCARVLANFGLEDWVAAGPGACAWRGTEAERTGAPAREVLEALRRAPDLLEAARGCSCLIGFSARSGRDRPVLPAIRLGELRRRYAGERVALVFGREDRGLEQEEAEACTALVRLPARGLPSFNLSHAVALALYEWFREDGAAASEEETPGRRLAPLEDRARLLAKAREELRIAGFRAPPEHLEGLFRRLAAWPLQTRDLGLLEKILRHVRWLREEGERGCGRNGRMEE